MALLVVGGIALVNAISGEPDPKGPVTASPSAEPGKSKKDSGTPAARLPLKITVTGGPTTVFVKVAGGGGEVLTNETLKTGDTRQYQKAPLNVVAANGGSLEVVIYGETQAQKPDGQRGQWFVRARD
ncbi:hypothetical protein [Spirillospora albida]|uniref:hypothetical protein n=1 Tax=Spirillospora albida TaxID=58123 RepID=UPI0012F92EA1|nr:hypothetical protein [Spirillospora albida]